jgi:Ca2+-binding EF-hand superfamily protein
MLFSVLHSVYEMLGVANGNNKAKVLFDKMDTNKDGVVEKKEFMSTCEAADNKMIF